MLDQIHLRNIFEATSASIILLHMLVGFGTMDTGRAWADQILFFFLKCLVYGQRTYKCINNVEPA